MHYLISGLTHGFRVGVSDPPSSPHVSKNLRSALNEPEIATQLIEKEVTKGFMLGPFKKPPLPAFRASPVGIATRKYSGKKRLIIDLSAPHSGPIPSINSLIPREPYSLFYATVDHAMLLIKQAGRGAQLSKADISDAFKVMPLHPSQWPMFGIKWQSQFYFSVKLTFGGRSSPAIFNVLAEALCWALLNYMRVPAVLHYLDDFLLIDPPGIPSVSLDKLRGLFQRVGVPISEEKTLGPLTSLEFLGITLDSERMQASLPLEKLARISKVSHEFSTTAQVSKREALSLLGHLTFAMKIIPQGRSFVSRLLTATHAVPGLLDSVTLDEGCRSDLRFWGQLLAHWNGISFFYEDVISSADDLKFFTDAAPSLGFGGMFQNRWFAGSWPREFADLDQSSALYEMYPIVVACHLWGHFWARKRIAVKCDNSAVVAIVNKGRSACPDIMPFVRRLTWLSVTLNFIIVAQHLPGHSNTVADHLSRFNFQAFRRLCPEADPEPTPIPDFAALTLS